MPAVLLKIVDSATPSRPRSGVSGAAEVADAAAAPSPVLPSIRLLTIMTAPWLFAIAAAAAVGARLPVMRT